MLSGARKADERLLDLLRDQPMKQAAIAKALDAAQSSTQARLQRLRAKGLVPRDEAGLWSTTST
jgi:DNA-binding IclR family transcriptional regulator